MDDARTSICSCRWRRSLGAIIVGLFGPKLGRAASHWLCILGVAIAHGRRRIVIWADVLRRARLQRRRLHVAAVGDAQVLDRLPDRPADRDDDAGRHVRVADGARLHDRLHGRRPRLHALLLLHLAVHVLDADAGDEQQLPAALLRLGGGGPRLLPADRLLVHAADGDLREPQGVPRQPRRRFRLRARHRPRPRVLRHARLRAGVRQGAELAGDDDQPLGRGAVVAADA